MKQLLYALLLCLITSPSFSQVVESPVSVLTRARTKLADSASATNRNLIDKSKERTSLKDFAVDATGVVDCRTLLLAASNASKTLDIPAGTYKISSDITVAVPVNFLAGAKIKPDSGVFVTLAGGYTAPSQQQVFDLSANGFVFATKQSETTQYHWGAIGDNVADDTKACQALINNCIYYRGSSHVKFAAGRHKITTLHFGYSTDLRSFTVEGAGPATSAGTNFVGTYFETASFENGFEIAGTRNAMFKNFTLQGPWSTYLLAQNMANIGELIDSTVEANWYPTATTGWSSDAVTRYKFSTGIHVDPRAGPRPAVSYSDVTYPSWLGSVPQYGKGFSSNPTFENVDILGFGIGVAVQGADTDGNGDYLKLSNCSIKECLIGIAWGNTQARLNSASNCQFVRVFEGIATTRIGVQNGHSKFKFDNCELGLVIKFANVPNMSQGGGIHFLDCYGEVCYSIGDISTTSSSGGTVVFTGGHFNFEHTGRPLPKYILRLSYTNLSIRGTIFSILRTPFIIDGAPENVDFSGQAWNVNYADGATRAVAYMTGSTAHVMFLNANQGPWSGRLLQQEYYSPATGAIGNPRQIGDFFRASSLDLIPFCARSVTGNVTPSHMPIQVALGQWRSQFDFSQLTSISQTGRTLTFSLDAVYNKGLQLNLGLSVGSILYHSTTQNLFLITAIAANQNVTAKLLNNYHDTTLTPVSPTTAVGTFYFIPTGFYVPSRSTRLTWTAGSSAVVFTQADGTNNYQAEFPVGCAKVSLQSNDPMGNIPENLSDIITSVAGTLTFAGAGTIRSEVTDSGVWIATRD